jgi:type IV pilus assembly protein PilP
VKKHTAELLASVKQEGEAADRADTYNPKGKPDPFAALFRDEAEEATASSPVVARAKRKKRMPTTPLEKVDLSQLKLVATVRSPNGNAALVEDASGKGFIVKKGTYIGINAGSVVQIIKDRIVVEEEIETLLGEISLQKRELKLQKPPGE